MWCNVCQSDVAIEVGADHRRVTCSTCGTVLGATAVSRENEQPASSTQGHRVTEARDLLDRWASNHLFDPYGPPKRPVSVDDVIEEATPRRPAANSGQTAAIDTPIVSKTCLNHRQLRLSVRDGMLRTPTSGGR